MEWVPEEVTRLVETKLVLYRLLEHLISVGFEIERQARFNQLIIERVWGRRLAFRQSR